MNVEMPPEAEFGIKIDFDKGAPSPSRIFKAAEELISVFESIDKDLVDVIDARIEPILVLEDIQAGSLFIWLRNTLKAIDDEALRNIDWKPQVGKYLVKGKYVVIDLLNKCTTVTNREPFDVASTEIKRLSEETDVKYLPDYKPVSIGKLMRHVELLSQAKSSLVGEDSVTYKTSERDIDFNMAINVTPESFEEILTSETHVSQPTTMILRVKKPDYLGKSKWEFHHAGKIVEAKILDVEWLNKFQNRLIIVRPGDALRCNVEITTKYGYDQEVLKVNYDIVEVIDVIAAPTIEQLELGGEGN